MNKLLRALRRRHEPDAAALSARLDGELDAAAVSALDGHVASCAACQALLAELRSTREVLRAMPAVVEVRSFRVRAADVERVSRVVTQTPRALLLVPALGALAAIVLVVAGGIDLSGNVSRDSSSDRAERAPASGAMRSSNTASDKSMASSAVAANAGAAGSGASSPSAGGLAPAANPPAQGSPAATAHPEAQDSDAASGSAVAAPSTALSEPNAAARRQTETNGSRGSLAATTTSGTARAVANENSADAAQAPAGANDNAVATITSKIFGASNRAEPPGNNTGGISVLQTIEIVAGALTVAAAALTLFWRLHTKEELR